MFVVCFGDGLGNQMFQYAFYKALQEKYPENDVAMDVFRIYGTYIHNGFELTDVFGIKKNEVQLEKALRLADYWPKTKMFYRFMNKLHGMRRYLWGPKESFIVQDDPTGFYEDVFGLPNTRSYMFCGNWVNEKYFEGIKNLLLKDFVFPKITDDRNIAYAEKIINSESVSVHIRKGDYVDSAMLNLLPEYYALAKKELEMRVCSPKYFIFTDDKDRIMEYLRIFKEFTIIEGNIKTESFRDMQLMSFCKHNIIANSTFSFWGAYLNSNCEKIVIAPDKAKYDFRNPFACHDWITIPYTG